MTEEKKEHNENKVEVHSSSSMARSSPVNQGSWKNYAIVALATALVVIGGMWLVNTLSSGNNNIPTGAAPSDDLAAPTVRVDLDIEGSPFIGDENAPVTIVEFSDYQCPFCGRFFTDTEPLIKSQYIDAGKVKLVYKDFPLDQIHPEATPAAHAARCAGDQAKYWEFHDKILDNQALLGSSSYSKWASELGLDTAKFDECQKSSKYLGLIRDDLQQGSSAGVRGTPAFLINGVLVSGAQPFSVFQQIIESELA